MEGGMRTLSVFNMTSLDGYICDRNGDMSWAHRSDPEWTAFGASNASGTSTLLFGRVTYEMMLAYWPTAEAARNDPDVAAGMNRARRLVFSRTLTSSPWAGTGILAGDPAEEVRALKAGEGPPLVLLGSASIAALLSQARLIDEYQVAVLPVALGGGRTMFDGLSERLELRRTEVRPFGNGAVFLRYALA
jgi:dihydrofolate reductase